MRENILSDARFHLLERTFGELSNAMRYFSKLPTNPLTAARHLLTVRDFPVHLAEAALTRSGERAVPLPADA